MPDPELNAFRNSKSKSTPSSCCPRHSCDHACPSQFSWTSHSDKRTLRTPSLPLQQRILTQYSDLSPFKHFQAVLLKSSSLVISFHAVRSNEVLSQRTWITGTTRCMESIKEKYTAEEVKQWVEQAKNKEKWVSIVDGFPFWVQAKWIMAKCQKDQSHVYSPSCTCSSRRLSQLCWLFPFPVAWSSPSPAYRHWNYVSLM